MKHRDQYDSQYTKSKNTKLLEIIIKDNETYHNENYSEIEKPQAHCSPLVQKKVKKKSKGNKERSTNSPKQHRSRPDLASSASNSQIHYPLQRSNLYRTNSTDLIPNHRSINHDFHPKAKTEKLTMMSFSPSNVTCFGCTDLANEKRRLTKLLKAVNENLEKNELKEIINLYRQELKAQWTQLAQVIDALLLYTFTISTFILLFYLAKQAPNANIF